MQDEPGWRCSYCKKDADYHAVVNNKHFWYCVDHWWTKYLGRNHA